MLFNATGSRDESLDQQNYNPTTIKLKLSMSTDVSDQDVSESVETKTKPTFTQAELRRIRRRLWAFASK